MKPVPAGIPFLMACCLWMSTLKAQDKLIIAGKAPDTYVTVKANGTDNLQQISNLFGLSVTKLLSYNNSNINPAITLPRGTEIRIPVTKDNLLQSAGENSEPVYHVIRKGENLYRMTQYYAVSLASLRQWNKLNKDIVKDGQPIVVGYLVNAKPVAAKPAEPVKEMSAAVPEKKVPEKKEPVTMPVPVKKKDSVAVAKNTVTADKKVIVPPPVVAKPADNKPVANTTTKQPESKPAETKPLVVNPPLAGKDSATVPAQSAATEKKEPAPVVVKKTEPVTAPPVEKPAESKPVEKKTPVVVGDPAAANDYKPKEGDEGFYALGYAAHDAKLLKQFRSGEAAVFKTASGWSDRKFYVLMNDVPPRTIIRITSSATGKNICAMVLGPLQEVKASGGLMLRISNAAAAALGVNETRFNVSIAYFIE